MGCSNDRIHLTVLAIPDVVPDLPPQTLPLASSTGRELFWLLGSPPGFLQTLPPYLNQLNKKVFLSLCANVACC